MRLLIGHMATTSAWARFVQAQRWQDVVGPIVQFDQIVVTEREENQLPKITTVIERRGELDGTFNLSAMRNRVREYAKTNGYDGFIIIESDFVVLRMPTCFPATWSVPYAVYTYPNQQSFIDLPENYRELQRVPRDWENLGGRRMMVPVHCVLVNSRMYDKAVWDEGFIGCGYDDWDFNNTMSNTGYCAEYTDMLLLHRWHETSGAMPRIENRVLYESKWGPIP